MREGEKNIQFFFFMVEPDTTIKQILNVIFNFENSFIVLIVMVLQILKMI